MYLSLPESVLVQCFKIYLRKCSSLILPKINNCQKTNKYECVLPENACAEREKRIYTA